jgi:large subunit ribosomal protein L32
MAVPKQKTSKSKRNHRRSHHKIVPKQLSACKNCGAMHILHHICENCGFYKDKIFTQIIKKKKSERFDAEQR